MKIALVSPYDDAYPGGVTEHVQNLAEQFRARGHDVHVLAPSSSSPAKLPATPNVHRVGRAVSILANGSVVRTTLPGQGYWRVKRLLTYQAFDIVHLHEPMMPALPLTVLRHSQAINIGTFHAFGRTDIGYFYAKPVLQPFFRRLHGRIAVSGPARDFVARHFPGDYEVIPNGIDYARFATPIEPLTEPRADGPSVLFVGRFEKRKGLTYLLRAWPIVRRELPSARLVVVGGGGRRLESYRRYAAKRGWSEVCFLGHVSADELVRSYQTADVFCAPSTGQESFGIVLLEAMAAGRPVVATSVGAVAEVVVDGETGLLVPYDASAPRAFEETLADALNAVVADPERAAAMGRAGRQRAVEHFGWDAIAERTVEVYRSVL